MTELPFSALIRIIPLLPLGAAFNTSDNRAYSDIRSLQPSYDKDLTASDGAQGARLRFI